MNSAHLHIILVHIPIVLIPLAGLFLAIAIKKKNETIADAGLFILLGGAIFAISAYLLGEGAEDIVKHIPGIRESLIEAHEEAAEKALWGTVVVGVFGLGALLASRWWSTARAPLLRITLILVIPAALLLLFTAQKGGMIRHPEAFESGDLSSPTSSGEPESH